MFNGEAQFNKDFTWQKDKCGIRVDTEDLHFHRTSRATPNKIKVFDQNNFVHERSVWIANLVCFGQSVCSLLGRRDLQRNLKGRASDCKGRIRDASQMRVFHGCPKSRPETLGNVKTFNWLLFVDVDVIKVTARARGESRNKSLAIGAAEHLLKIIRVIGAVLEAADGIRMHCEDRQASERVLGPRLAQGKDANIGIGGSGNSHDVCIELAGVESDFSVLHPVTAIESEILLSGDAGFDFSRAQF